MFGGIQGEKVLLIEEGTYRRWSYLLDEDYTVFYENAEYPLDHIPPHSIIKCVLINAEVREIILVHKAS